MSTRRLFKVQFPCQKHRRAPATAASTASTVSTTPSPPPPPDPAALQLQSKLTLLENPNPNPRSDHTPMPRVTTLPNGLRVATESIPSATTATVCVSIDTGSRFDTSVETSGVACFLLSMVFRGTLKRSRSDFDELKEKMSLTGATSREQTVYTVDVEAGDVAEAVEVLADMLQNSTFDDKVIEDERNVIMNRMLKANSQLEDVIAEFLHLTAFQHAPLGWTVYGCPDTFMTITKKDIQDYLSTHYTTQRMVITASGAVNHEDFVEQVKKMFTKLSTNPVTSAQLVKKKPAVFTGSEMRMVLECDCEPFAHFGIAFKGASWTDPDSVALQVMQLMLGSWHKASDFGTDKRSLLARMAGINELAQIVKAELWQYKDTGLIGVYAAAKPECLRDLASAIMQEMSKLCYQVAEEDVVRAQNQLKSSISEKEATAVEIGRQLLVFGRVIPSAELFAKIDAVDVATVKRVAKKYISGQDIAIAAAGKERHLPDYNWFRNRNTVFRC